MIIYTVPVLSMYVFLAGIKAKWSSGNMLKNIFMVMSLILGFRLLHYN